MKDLLNWLKEKKPFKPFKTSILVIVLLYLIVISNCIYNIYFEDKISEELISNKLIFLLITIAIISLIFIIVFAILIMIYKIPIKNKFKKTGVLFVIVNANKEFENVKRNTLGFFDKCLGENNIDYINAICLSKTFINDKNEQKYFSDEKNIQKLLQKTNCLFCLKIWVDEPSINNYDEYTIKTSLIVAERVDKKNKEIDAPLYFFNELVKNKVIDKKNDCELLNDFMSNVFYYINIINNMSLIYSDDKKNIADGVDQLFNYLSSNVEYKEKNFYYESMSSIIDALSIVFHNEYFNFIEKGIFNEIDINKINKIVKLLLKDATMLDHITKLKKEVYIRYYHCMAITKTIEKKYNEANTYLHKLKQHLGDALSDKTWVMNNAFLFAIQAKKEDYKKIYYNYYNFARFTYKNNEYIVKQAYDFINKYHDNIESNLGIKIAIICFWAFRKEIPSDYISDSFIDETIKKIDSLGLSKLSNLLKERIKEKFKK